MKLSIAVSLCLGTMAVSGYASSAAGGEVLAEDTDHDGEAVVWITETTIIRASGADVVRRRAGQTVLLHNVSASDKRVVLWDSNVLASGAEYRQALKIDVPAGASVQLGTGAHPLPSGATFIGFDVPSLARGRSKFALFAVWVGDGLAEKPTS